MQHARECVGVCGSSNILAFWCKLGSRRKDFSLLHPFLLNTPSLDGFCVLLYYANAGGV